MCVLAGCVWLLSLAQARAVSPLDGLVSSWPGQQITVTLAGVKEARVESGAPLTLRIATSQPATFAILLVDGRGNARLWLPEAGPQASLQAGQMRIFPRPASGESLPADMAPGPAQVYVIVSAAPVFSERKQLPDETSQLVHAGLADALRSGQKVAWQSLQLTVTEPLPADVLRSQDVVDFFSRRGTYKGAQQSLLVRFDFGTDRLTELGRQQLQELARALNDPAIRGMSFLLEGHTDDVGTDAYNKALSERRARSARKFLLLQHVASARLRADGVGKADPVVDPLGDIQKTREMSRRVVIRRVDALE
jgi:outer membrane protein OmpA-like peptidoglycan-associated protein